MIYTCSPENLQKAARRIQKGRLVVFPTETVYGLGADATNETAVHAIFTSKGRPSFNPLIIHVTDSEQACRYGHFTEKAILCAKAFWPGPLTIVVPLIPSCRLAPSVTGGLSTVALRIPANNIARTLLTYAQKPIAAPSANVSGKLSPTCAEHVLSSPWLTPPEMIIDGGPCLRGLESTIIDFTHPEQEPTILRQGVVTRQQLEEKLGYTVKDTANQCSKTITAPGQMLKHYAPYSPLLLNVPPEKIMNKNLFCLGFGPHAPQNIHCLNLSKESSLEEAAARLFYALHKLDQQAKGETIYVMSIPNQGIGRAINDRLERAAACLSKTEGLNNNDYLS